MKQIIFFLVSILIPIRIGNCLFTKVSSKIPVSSAPGAEVFGVTDITEASSEICSTGDSLINRNFGNICIANLLDELSANLSPFSTLDVFYRTVFELTVMNHDKATSRDIRFTQFDRNAATTDYDVTFVLDSSVVTQLCGAAGKNCFLDDIVDDAYTSISKDFFTDFKMDISNGHQYSDCNALIDSCSSSLCIYFNPLIYTRNCFKCYVVSVGIREKRGGGSANNFKTIEVNAIMKGRFRTHGASDAFYNVKNDELIPLIKAAACTTQCLEQSSGMTYCGGDAECPAGSTLVEYDGSIGADYPEHLISEYAYIREHECNSGGTPYNVCASLMTATPAAYASDNIIFDHDLGGKPRCDCAPTHMWDDITKACVERPIISPLSTSSLSTKWVVPCYGRCDDNEECMIGNDEVQRCYCKPHFSRRTKQGKCEPKINCENGRIITSQGVVCECNDGYYRSNYSGLCILKSQLSCTSDTNLPACSTVENNLSPCTCDNGSIIPSGMCELSNCDCGANEECAVNESGRAVCACKDGYTKLYKDDICFAILECQPDETLRYDDDDILCNCKEGKIAEEEEDIIVCQDGNYNKFDCFFCLLFIIIVNVLNSFF